MISEFIIGRHGASNTARAYTKLSNGTAWKWVGYLEVLTGFLITGYYAVVSGWCLQYPGYMEDCRRLGLDVNVWTINREADMKACMKAGVHAVITNYPDRAIKVREELSAGRSYPV